MSKALIDKVGQQQIVTAIQEAEKRTSGEIKVHVEQFCPQPQVLDRAKAVFWQLQLDNTMRRNGVLFYIALKDHKFAILGDEGIDKAVPANFWEHICDTMRTFFSQGSLVEGLCEGIRMAGEQLKVHFPYQEDDENEINDELSFG
jgi:uncharacterized membrane protein